MFDIMSFTPLKLLGMLIFLAIGLCFIIWVKGFRKTTRELMKNKNIFLTVSAVLIIICIGTLIFNYINTGTALNYGLDFTGGTIIQLAVKPEVDASHVREAIEEFSGTMEDPSKLSDPKIQMAAEIDSKTDSDIPSESGNPEKEPFRTKFDNGSDDIVGDQVIETERKAEAEDEESKRFEDSVLSSMRIEGQYRRCMIQVKEITSGEVDRLITHLNNKLGDMELLQVETIGPTIGKELKTKAIWALLIALAAQLIYITFRFGTQLRYGISADIALLHDIIIMVGLYTLLGKPVDSSFLAALLTIIGYSVMDSVVVFDRIRENLKLMKGTTYEETVNLSLNQVMTRTAATSFTTILTLFAIYYFGGKTLNNFALALLIGAVAGTYSSLFIASPLVILIDNKVKSKEKLRVEERRAKLQAEAQEKARRKAEATAKPAKEEKAEKEKNSIVAEDYPSPDEVSDGEQQAGRKKGRKRKR